MYLVWQSVVEYVWGPELELQTYPAQTDQWFMSTITTLAIGKQEPQKLSSGM